MSDLKVLVKDGFVHPWGSIGADPVHRALVVAATEAPGVRDVRDHLSPWHAPDPMDRPHWQRGRAHTRSAMRRRSGPTLRCSVFSKHHPDFGCGDIHDTIAWSRLLARRTKQFLSASAAATAASRLATAHGAALMRPTLAN